jgi:hypothetical protein
MFLNEKASSISLAKQIVYNFDVGQLVGLGLRL